MKCKYFEQEDIHYLMYLQPFNGQTTLCNRLFALQATGSWDYSVCVWSVKGVTVDSYDSNSVPLLHSMSGHTGNVRTVAFSREGMLVSCSSLSSSLTNFRTTLIVFQESWLAELNEHLSWFLSVVQSEVLFTWNAPKRSSDKFLLPIHHPRLVLSSPRVHRFSML